MQKEVEQLFGHRLRVRVSGIEISGNSILLINHHGIGELGSLWAPPGGGLEYGETMEQALVREFKEETGLDIIMKEFLFINEFLSPPLHAIELFFRVEAKEGCLTKGTDPEMTEHLQLIQDIRYWSFEKINESEVLLFHTILRNIPNIEEFLKQKNLLRDLHL
jgi:8-oxo-dGTP diphosphatase